MKHSSSILKQARHSHNNKDPTNPKTTNPNLSVFCRSHKPLPHDLQQTHAFSSSAKTTNPNLSIFFLHGFLGSSFSVFCLCVLGFYLISLLFCLRWFLFWVPLSLLFCLHLSSLIFVFYLFACVRCFMISGFCCKTRISQTRFPRKFCTNRICDTRFQRAKSSLTDSIC